MSMPALAVLEALAHATIDALREDGDPGGMGPFAGALERVRHAGALGLFARVRAAAEAPLTAGVLTRLERELLAASCSIAVASAG